MVEISCFNRKMHNRLPYLLYYTSNGYINSLIQVRIAAHDVIDVIYNCTRVYVLPVVKGLILFCATRYLILHLGKKIDCPLVVLGQAQ